MSVAAEAPTNVYKNTLIKIMEHDGYMLPESSER